MLEKFLEIFIPRASFLIFGMIMLILFISMPLKSFVTDSAEIAVETGKKAAQIIEDMEEEKKKK